MFQVRQIACGKLPAERKRQKDIEMANSSEKFPALVKEVRRQLGISQEELAHKLGVSFATINRWENGKTTPFKLARGQFDAFCRKMAKQGNLNLPGLPVQMSRTQTGGDK